HPPGGDRPGPHRSRPGHHLAPCAVRLHQLPGHERVGPPRDQYAKDPDALPLGAHIQLSPAFDVADQSWPRWEKVVGRALQVYGAYVVDLGGTVAVRGEA